MSWFTNLGEKTGRTDIWIVLVVLFAAMFASPIFLMSIGTVPMNTNVYDESLDMIKWILSGMFIDLGIYSWRQTINNKKDVTLSSRQDAANI